MSIAVLAVLAGLIATEAETQADGYGDKWRVGCPPLAAPGDFFPFVISSSDGGVQAIDEGKDKPSGMVTIGILISSNRRWLVIKGAGTKENPLKIRLRLLTFATLTIDYWEASDGEGDPGRLESSTDRPQDGRRISDNAVH